MTQPSPGEIILVLAAAIRGASTSGAAASRADADAAIALRNGKCLAAGSRTRVLQSLGDLARQARIIEHPGALILPAMVNAHAHLDLTSLGPQPPAASFTDWLRRVMTQAPREDQAVTQAVEQGALLSRQAGVGWVGDIARSLESIDARLRTGLPGISFLECFGLSFNPSQVPALHQHLLTRDAAAGAAQIALGLQPHAPYSAGLGLYMDARSPGRPLSTHLAETPEETQFVATGSGPFMDLLRDLGKSVAWQPHANHPVTHLKPALQAGHWLAAHCNYVTDEHIRILQKCSVSVAYCPIASEYFGHRNHRYRDMLAAGVNVCLGTDSILCQPESERQPLGILAQVRRLYRRDGTAPDLLLQMATSRGLIALGLDPSPALLAPGCDCKLMAVPITPGPTADPLLQALTSDAPAFDPLG